MSGFDYRARNNSLQAPDDSSLIILYRQRYQDDPQSDDSDDDPFDSDNSMDDVVHATLHGGESAYSIDQQLERAVRVHPELLQMLRSRDCDNEPSAESSTSSSESDPEDDPGDDFLRRCDTLRNSLLRWV
jgi:hypothetical protein